MSDDRWIPIVEQSPPEKKVVVVCETHHGGVDKIYAGWLAGEQWFSFDPESGLGRRDIRATDFWLSLPEWPAGGNVVRTMQWPA